jgi:outer membrane protein TolC
VWDWGKNRAGEREAKHRREQARLAHGGLVDQVAFDVRRRVVDAQTAWETLEAARSGLKAAEEAYRIQSVRFEGGAATTTDVLDAETEVQRARAAYALARYDYFIALVALARGVGEVPREIR